MTTPISNDKILPSDSSNSAVTGKKRAEQEVTTQQSASSNPISQDEKSSSEASSVDVERANQVYSQSQPRATLGEDSISNQEQAMAVAAEIRSQIEENAQQALKAQAESGSSSLAALLETAPV